MKKIIIVIILSLISILLLSIQCFSQIITKKDIAPITLMFVSGFCDGTSEASEHHFQQMDAKFNYKLNDQWWNADISWTNKYKNHDPQQGPAYFGSTTFLVWTTDAYHMFRMGRNITAITAVTIKIGEKQKWWEYPIEAIIYYLTYTLGFTFAYDFVWK